MKSRESQRTEKRGPQRWEGAMNVSRLLCDPGLLPKHGAVEGNLAEFGSPRGREENRGLRRQAHQQKRDLGRHVEKGCRDPH